MKRCLFWFKALIALAVVFSTIGPAQLAHAAPPADEEVDAQIANAESAGIAVVAKDATIMGWDDEGLPSVLLREGSNDWTCLADWPASPGNDPQCFDTVWAAWNEAFMAGDDPELDGPGIGYMLAGGSDPSNTDPFAMEPAAGEEWISTPPHMMILAPGGFDGVYFATEPKQDEPYIMWDGTPYEHLMVPVVAMTDEEMGDADAELQNIMSSAPAGVIRKAMILGNPAEDGGDMVVLQEDDSGWVCYADRPVSPGNDPACYDSMWEELFGVAEPPEITRAGVSYMLAGGSDESNTDPMATGPGEGEEWITTPPHLMLLVPGGFDADIFTTDHGSGYPYIMWDDTAYEHLMIPVADMDAMEMGAKETDEEALKAQILAEEIGTFDALIAHDVAGTEAVIAEDFVWINADGARLGREDLLEVVGDMALAFEQPVRDNVEVQILSPDAAVIVYTIEFDGTYDGDSFSADEYTTSIWQLRDDRWQNTLLQSTRRPVNEADAQIANAESAGIAVVAKDATIMGWDDEGLPSVLLREGSNDWTCLADWPASPGNDPQCFDTVWAAWNEAFMAGDDPELDGPGIGYMLAGGSDPSNTDPFAMEPAAGEEWISTPPHMMILAPGGFDGAYFATEPKQDEPYIMWDGTPYEHLMVPVVAMTAEEMGDTDAELQIIMSAAPAGVIRKAMILGNPAEDGGDMVVLQEGDSGWVCYPDRPGLADGRPRLQR